MDPFEHAEEAMMILGIDSNAIVLDPQSNGTVVSFGPELEFWFGAGSDKFYAVRKQVGNGLGEGGFVGEHILEWLADFDFRGGRLHLRILLDHFRNQFLQRRRFEDDLGTGQPGVRQNVMDELLHPGAAVENPANIFAGGRIERFAVILKNHLGISPHGAHGRSQVMRDAVGKFLHLGDSLPQ
jgi:hypothetical protein